MPLTNGWEATSLSPVFLINKFMKKLLLVSLLSVFALAATAQTFMKVQWDPNQETNVVSYGLYYKTVAAASFSVTNVVGRLSTNAAFAVSPATAYEVYVTAKDALGLESDPSNKIRGELIYVNGLGRPTVITLHDAGTANFTGFVLVNGPTNGTLVGTAPNVTYTITGGAHKDIITYKSPELSGGANITNYYAFYKAITNGPPTIQFVP